MEDGRTGLLAILFRKNVIERMVDMENVLIWGLFEVITALLEAIIYYWFFSNILDKRLNRATRIIGPVFFTAVLVIGHYCNVAPSLKMAIVIPVNAFFIWKVYDAPIGKVVVGNVVLVIATIISETVVMGLLMYIHKFENATIFLNENEVRFQATFMAKILYFIFLLFVVKKSNPYRHDYGIKEVALLVVQAISSMVTILLTIETAIASIKVYEIPTYFFSILGFGCLATYFISIWLTERYFIIQREREEYLKMQSYTEKRVQYYEMKKESQEQIRQMYHDLQYHIQAIEKMKDKHLNDLEEYVNDMRDMVTSYDNYYNTGNVIVDMILHERKNEAASMGISFKVICEPNCLDGFKTMYLCTIFSNAIDNAITAATECRNEEKVVEIKMSNGKEGVSILFNNFFLGERKNSGQIFYTTKSDKSRHGLGLSSIQEVVAKCGGRMDIKTNKNIFTLYILLHMT